MYTVQELPGKVKENAFIFFRALNVQNFQMFSDFCVQQSRFPVFRKSMVSRTSDVFRSRPQGSHERHQL